MPNRITEKGASRTRLAQEKRGPKPPARKTHRAATEDPAKCLRDSPAPDAARSRRPSTGEQTIGHYLLGLTFHTIHRCGARYTLTRHIIERFTRNAWRRLDARTVPSPEQRRTVFEEFRAQTMTARRRSALLEKSVGGLRLRARLETERIPYQTALRLVCDHVLIPAIGEAIPYCLSRDLWTTVGMNTAAGQRRPGREEQCRIVGVAPLRVPPGVVPYHPRRRK